VVHSPFSTVEERGEEETETEKTENREKGLRLETSKWVAQYCTSI
jgi:hypothetical protein